MESEHPYLEIKNAEGEKKISLHDRNSGRIGRSPENGLVFDDDAMSRRHALIQQPRPGKFYLIVKSPSCNSTDVMGFDVALGRLTFECLSGAAGAANYFEKRLLELKGYDKPVETWLISYSQLREFLATGD